MTQLNSRVKRQLYTHIATDTTSIEYIQRKSYVRNSTMPFNSYQVSEGRAIWLTRSTASIGFSPHVNSGQYYVQVKENNVQFAEDDNFSTF